MDNISVNMKSSNVEPALDHLNELRNTDNSGGIGVLIRKLLQARRRFRWLFGIGSCG